MRKTGLFKIIMFILLGIVVTTWIFSASYINNGELVELGMYNVGFFDFFQLLFGSFEFEYFIQIFILLVSIGALYGVLGKTGKYRAWIEKVANRMKGSEVIFLLATAFVIAALKSVFDYGLSMFIFFPLLISIILAMGYDKVTAALTTFGAMLVGTIGNTISYNTAGTISNILSAESSTGIYFKIALFVLSLAALFFFLVKAKRTKVLNKNADEDMFIGEKSSNKYSIVPIIVVLSVLFVLMVIGCTNWSKEFNINFFSDLNSTITKAEVKLPHFHVTTDGVDAKVEKVAIFGKLFGTVSAFGEWYYSEMAVMCLLAALIIGAFFRMKWSERLSYMAEGAKKMLAPALLVVLSYTVIYFAGNTMFYTTIANLLLSITSKFNIFFSTIVAIIGSALHVDILYVANYVVPQLATQDVNTALIAILVQSIYGVTMFVAPTSIAVILGLSYLNIPYKEWIKKTWKLVLTLFAIVVVVLIAAMIIL